MNINDRNKNALLNVDLLNADFSSELSSEHPQIAIIGSGPSGLFAGFSCLMLGMQPTIFEKNHIIGGQCNALYPDKAIYDIPAIPSIKAKDFITQLEKQVFDNSLFTIKPIIKLNTLIDSIEPIQDGVIINGKKFQALIIAAGFGACIPNKLALLNAEKYEDKQIFYNITDDEIFKNKKVIILGGGNSAADWALHMCKIASNVTLIHRRDALTAFASSVALFQPYIDSGKLNFLNSTNVTSLIESNDKAGENKIIGLNIIKNNISEQIEADYIIACYGMKSDLSAIHNFGLKMHKDSFTPGDQKILIDENCQTNINRVYSVGDIAYGPNKTKLFSILSGFYECTIASNHIYKTLGFNPNKLQHSSDIK